MNQKQFKKSFFKPLAIQPGAARIRDRKENKSVPRYLEQKTPRKTDDVKTLVTPRYKKWLSPARFRPEITCEASGQSPSKKKLIPVDRSVNFSIEQNKADLTEFHFHEYKGY